jgi:hypothetical protein
MKKTTAKKAAGAKKPVKAVQLKDLKTKRNPKGGGASLREDASK